jgi:CRP/FNR family transcriptional regulator, cyclic AMP receptor protein
MVERAYGVDKREILASHEFFERLPVQILDRLAAMSRTVAYAAGTSIFAKGDEGLGLLAVLSGMVKISATGEDGREVVLNRIGKGEIFGEIALLDGLPRTADASAMTACRLLMLDRRSFLPLLAEEPALGVRLLELVSRRLRRTSEQVESLSFEAAGKRLAKALFRLADMQGAGSAAEPRVTITQRELGDTIGLSRESTNKQLREWKTAGLIALEKGGCVIRDPVALRRRAGLPR